MFCLLCHEKISRLRSWRTKSEFCCDEHAEIYKRQTLDRLLTDHRQPSAPAPLLQNDDSAVEVAEADDPADAAEALEPRAAYESHDAGADELFRLAEEVGQPNRSPAADSGHLDTGVFDEYAISDEDLGELQRGAAFSGGTLFGDPATGEVGGQTPDEALAALRSLASARSSSSHSAPITESDPSDGLTEIQEPQLAGFDEDLLSSPDDLLLGEPLPSLEDPAASLDDDAMPSFLEELERSPEGPVIASPDEELDAVAELTRRIATDRQDVQHGEVDGQPAGEQALAAEEIHAAASKAGPKPKVVPFPSLRRAQQVEKPESPEQPAVAGEAESEPAAKTAKTKRAVARGKGGRRLQLKPVSVMFGIEPSFLMGSPGGDMEFDPLSSGGIFAPLLCYPQLSSFGRRVGITPKRMLFSVLPETRVPQLQNSWTPDGAAPREWQCEFPEPLITGRIRGEGGTPCVGAQRAWMFLIEPSLAGIEGAAEQDLSNGFPVVNREPAFPPPLLNRMAVKNATAKLDLSGPHGDYGPPVDRLCGMAPQLCGLDDVGAAQGAPADSWVPHAVLGPRFDIEWPGSRDLSDLGQ